MRLSRSYQPRTLDEVVGQPAVIRRLKRLVALPQPCCLPFEGLGGVGKSATAKALIQELGVCPFSGLVEYSARNLSIDEVRRLFGQTFRYKPMAGNPWHILLIEELELIVSRHVNAALKDELRTSPLQGQLPSLSRAWEKGKTSMRSPVAPQENDATARKRLHLPQKAKQDRR
jgi:DNA polymerase III delta prime subunit